MSTDAVSSAIQIALHGLSDRQKNISDNISNIETPGYLAKQNDFESSLQAAMNGDADVPVNPTQKVSNAPTNTNGNNVDIDNETVSGIDTGLKYQAMISAMTAKFSILRSSIGS